MRAWIKASLLVCALAVLVAFKVVARSEPVDVAASAVVSRTIRVSALASGSIDFDRKVQISPEVIGKVMRVLVKEGERVERGQVMLVIDSQTLQSEAIQREAVLRGQELQIREQAINLKFSDLVKQRSMTLFERGFVTKASFDQAEQARDMAGVKLEQSRQSVLQARAALAQIRSEISRTVIRAPISGTVIMVGIKEGETAVPSTIGIAGSSLMTIVDPTSLVATVNVDEADIRNVRHGQKVAIDAIAFPDGSFEGEVATLALSPKRPDPTAPAAAAQARNYEVKVRLRRGTDVPLLPGMSCRAEIFVTSGRSKLTVPLQAVLTPSKEDVAGKVNNDEEQRSYVLVVSNGLATKRWVTLGASDDRFQEIKSGLRPGESVIEGPYKTLRFLKEGNPIVVSGRST